MTPILRERTRRGVWLTRQCGLHGDDNHCAGRKKSCSEPRLWELGEPLGTEAQDLGREQGSQIRHRLWVRLAMARESVGLGDHQSWVRGSGI